jgi:MYXO-CTERM domain-containing protein
MNLNIHRLVTVVALVAACWSANAAEQCGKKRNAGQIGTDIKAYVTAPLHAERQQWVRFGATVGAVAVAYHYDEHVRQHFVPAGKDNVPDTHDGSDAILAALALSALGLRRRSPTTTAVAAKREPCSRPPR